MSYHGFTSAWSWGKIVETMVQLAIVLTLAIIVIAIAWRITRGHYSDLASFAQGAAGLVTVLALITAAVIYFKEGRDRPRLDTSLHTRAIAIGTGKRRAALLHVMVTIKNLGFRTIVAQCTNLDIAPIPDEIPIGVRTEHEYGLSSMLRDVEHGASWQRCWDIRRKTNPNIYVPDSGYVWSDSQIPAGGSDTLYYEVTVPCIYAGVRVIVKVDKYLESARQEYRQIASLADVCAGREDRQYVTDDSNI